MGGESRCRDGRGARASSARKAGVALGVVSFGRSKMSVPKRPSLTIGIEEEYQTVDPETRDLRSHISAEIIQKGRMLLEERVKPEMHQSVVEIGTNVCRNIQEARAEVRDIRRQIVHLAKANGLRLVAGGTHPFAHW